jgi:hypothetical protein
MENSLLDQAVFLREVFDAIPAMLVIVDDDVRILHVNATASTGLGLNIRDIHHKRGGEALHCVHSTVVPEGCGKAPACVDCVIRNSVTIAVQGGKTFRKGTRMNFGTGDAMTELHLLISAAPFLHEKKSYVLLTIENVSELIQLKSLLPICMHCKKIRNDEGYWKDIAEYFNAHLDVDFSHGLCSDCLKKHYPDVIMK